MRETGLGQAAERELADQVLAELKKRFGGLGTVSMGKGRAVILGVLSPEEEKAVREFYDPAEFPAGQWDVAVAARLTVNTMVQLSLGIPQDPEAAFLLQGLLEGKKVYILEAGLEYRAYRNSSCKTLYRVYQDYEDALEKLGVCLIKDILEFRDCELSPSMAGSRERVLAGENKSSAQVLDFKNKKLLQESDLSHARGRGCTGVLIGKRTLVTPLAWDYINNHSLKVHQT